MDSATRIESRRAVRKFLSFAIVGGCSLVVIWAINADFQLWPLHFDAVFPFIHPKNPGALFRNTTANGGDMGAHVWAPAYLRDVLLPHGRISGWAPDWFAGFPALHFYFPLPSLLIVGLNAIHIPFTSFGIPYNVAFKLITVLGVSSMPISAYVMARCFGLRSPKAELVSISTLVFLFNTSFTIYGGNIASTLAGEFAFSISMSASLVFIGLYWQVLTKGRHQALAAVFLAIMIMSHVLPTIFAFIAVLIMYLFMFLFRLDFSSGSRTIRVLILQLVLLVNGLVLLALGRQVAGYPLGLLLILGSIGLSILHVERNRLRQGVIVGAIGVALAGIWLLPFAAQLRMSNDMGWGKETHYIEWIFKGPMKFAVPLAIIGFILSYVRNNKLGILLGLMSAVAIAIFVLAPQAQLWNARALPFWYLPGTLLAAIGVGELLAIAADAWEERYALFPTGSELSWVSLGGSIVSFILIVGFTAGSMGLLPDKIFRVVPVGLDHLNSKNPSFIQSWSRWNYSGYETKTAYPEYKALYTAMDEIGKDPNYGCGRAMWEYEKEEDRFGTPMALMLLPYWTDHCIGSLEGLYFESGASAPYHWIIQDQMSEHASDPQRDLPYYGQDLNLGVKHLQLMGVRYYLAITPSSQAQAANNPDLELIRTLPSFDVNYDSGQQKRSWQIYQVKNSDLVTPITNQPAVATGPVKSRPDWLELAMNWYTNQTNSTSYLSGRSGKEDTTVYFTDDGPKAWQRSTVNIDNPTHTNKHFWEPDNRTTKFGDAVTLSKVSAKPLPDVTVTNVKNDDDEISFDVDRVGVPVLVRMSYFPNWKVSGAKGPYRSTPNFMIVVPTQKHVTMHYGHTPVDWLGILLTIIGICGVVWLARRGNVEYPLTDPEYFQSTRSYTNVSPFMESSADLLRSLPEKVPVSVTESGGMSENHEPDRTNE